MKFLLLKKSSLFNPCGKLISTDKPNASLSLSTDSFLRLSTICTRTSYLYARLSYNAVILFFEMPGWRAPFSFGNNVVERFVELQ